LLSYSASIPLSTRSPNHLADLIRTLVWASAALPGSAHDLTAARTHGIIAALTLVMSCRARTRHIYDGTRRGGRMT